MGGEGEGSSHAAAGMSRDMAVATKHWSLIRESKVVELCPVSSPAKHTGPPRGDASTDGGLAAVCVIPPGGSWLDTACKSAQQFLAPL